VVGVTFYRTDDFFAKEGAVGSSPITRFPDSVDITGICHISKELERYISDVTISGDMNDHMNLDVAAVRTICNQETFHV
jgi:hypothetical protein